MEIKLTGENFSAEVLEADVPVLVDFWAPWCGPCRMLGPVIAQLAQEAEGKYKVGKVNVDEERGLAMLYGIRNIPTVIAFKGGKAVATSMGYVSKDKLLALLD